MNFWATPMTLLCFLLWTLIFYQKIKPDKPKNNVLLALIFAALCVTLGLPEIYVFLDNILGGKNLVYLPVNLTFLAATHFAWVAIQPEKIRLAKKVSAFSSTLIIVGFYFSDMPYTSVRVEDFRDQLAVLFFTQVLNAHAVVVAVFVMKKINFLVKKTKTFSTKFSLLAVFYGSLVGIITVPVRIALNFTTNDDSLHEIFTQVETVLVVILYILICGGLGLFTYQKKDSYNLGILKIKKLFRIKP